MQTDVLTLDVRSNPELESYFARKEPGEDCTLRVKASLDENANGIVRLSVSEVEVEAFRDQAKETAAYEEVPGPAPVMMGESFPEHDARQGYY